MMRWFDPLCLVLLLSASPTWAQQETVTPPEVTPQESSAAPEEAEPSEDEDRITFNIRLDDNRGGGRVEGWAGDFEYQEGDYLLATNGVRLVYKDLQLQADVARVDVANSLMTAEGNVVLDEGPRRLVGDTLEYSLDTRTGRITNATAYIENDYIFTGDEIAKVDDATYTLDEGVFTSCSQENPPWSIGMGHARITLENYARIKNARMRIGKVPMLYVPYMVWPTKTERSSGLLVPQPGYSTRRGFELSLAYYKTLGRSADTTFFADLSSQEFFGFGTELRYRPSENTEGFFEAFLVQDQDFKRLRETPGLSLPPGFEVDDLPEENRWKINWFHETRNLWGGFKGVLAFREFSDPSYRQDFERAVRRQSNSFIYSQAYLTRNFGQQSLNLMIDLRERIRTRTFVDPGENEERRVGEIIDTRRQLPEIEYRLRPTQLGGAPVYFSLDTNLHFLSIENSTVSRTGPNGELEAEEYGRGDIFPSFSLPLSTLPWLSFKVDVGGRVTHYTNSLDADTGRFSEEDKEITRTVGVAGAEIVGPSISRIFEKKSPKHFSKLKHIVEPRIVYSYLDDFEKEDQRDFADEEIPLFDEIDNRRLRNESSFSIINRLLAKPADEEEGGAFEIASLELRQSFSFDSDLFLQRGRDEAGDQQREREGPVRAILRLNPSQATSFKAEAAYNTLFGQMQSASLSGGTRIGNHNFGGSLFTRWGSAENADVSSNQARLFTSLALVPGKLTLDAAASYDIERSELLQQRYFINYQGSCYGLRFELRESTFGELKDRDFRFSFTLRNVGTFIDMNGSI